MSVHFCIAETCKMNPEELLKVLFSEKESLWDLPGWGWKGASKHLRGMGRKQMEIQPLPSQRWEGRALTPFPGSWRCPFFPSEIQAVY